MKKFVSACLLVCPLLALAEEPMVLCIEDQAAAPFTFPNKDGTMQILLKMASKEAAVPVNLTIAAWKRCIENTRSGSMNGIVNAGNTPFHAEYAAFPLLPTGKPNTGMSLASMSVMAYRVKGSKASWDGNKFTDVSKPVLIPAGFATISDQLKSLNTPFDDNVKEPLRNLHKLIAGQGEIVLGFETEMNSLIAGRKDVADKVEMVPTKFMTTDFYVAFNKAYYASHKAQVDALWNAIPKVKKSKEYQDAIKDIK
ncbi:MULTISPECIES: hypothetical protein [unclassified Janthinobacterium]|uniref:hypothetical protein n=1 Tax=unclassified Janthinobacterium TaxID=2610881 RepID=UPI000348FC81|nr:MULTISPECIES: hypothetical protein [unclassified Janthinobacterium]MEC5162026.1 polar amino acid transport system substrate-binding protein [Janthinobacterium sp. CG_S6]